MLRTGCAAAGGKVLPRGRQHAVLELAEALPRLGVQLGSLLVDCSRGEELLTKIFT